MHITSPSWHECRCINRRTSVHSSQKRVNGNWNERLHTCARSRHGNQSRWKRTGPDPSRRLPWRPPETTPHIIARLRVHRFVRFLLIRLTATGGAYGSGKNYRCLLQSRCCSLHLFKATEHNCATAAV